MSHPMPAIMILGGILRAVFSPEDEKKYPWLPLLWIGALILAGAILWGIFFNWGDVPIDYMDWAEVWAPRLQAWRDALLKNTLPFHLADVAAMRTTSDRYFAVADMVSSPQVVLLRWLDVGAYALVNNLLLYGLATYFLVKIRNKYSLSLFSFSILFLIFHFNGFIVTHLSVGHLSWGGYYLFPAFVLLLLEMLEGKRGWQWITGMSFVLFLIFMQGSFHHLVWCLIVLAALAVLRWRYFPQIALTGVFTVLLSLPRIIPAFMEEILYSKSGLDVLGGYPKVLNLVKALLYNSTPDMGMPRQIFESSLGYWEFDLFVGIAGFILIFILGLGSLAYWSYKKREFPLLIAPALILTVLAVDEIFARAVFYQPTLASMERVSSRMIGLALGITLVIAVIYYEKTLRLVAKDILAQLIQLAVLILLIVELGLHTLRWSVQNAYAAFPLVERDLSRIHVSNHADPEYFTGMAVGAAISLAAMAALIWLARKSAMKKRAETNSAAPDSSTEPVNTP